MILVRKCQGSDNSHAQKDLVNHRVRSVLLAFEAERKESEAEMLEETVHKNNFFHPFTKRVWCLNEVTVTLLLSNGRYNAEETGKLKGAVYTLLGFAGWSLHEDTNGYEVVHLLFSGRSSSEEIGELSAAFCELLGFAGWSPQEDTNGYEAVHLLSNGRYKAEERSW